MIPLANKERELHVNKKSSNIFKEEFEDTADKNYHRVRNYCHYTGKYRCSSKSICNLRYKIPKEIPLDFHNGSNNDYHFIIKELAEEFKGQFECLGGNTEKYIIFSVPIKNKLRIEKL